jgi:hypothetical protein
MLGSGTKNERFDVQQPAKPSVVVTLMSGALIALG